MDVTSKVKKDISVMGITASTEQAKPTYFWSILKMSSLLILITCITFTIYFTTQTPVEKLPLNWNIPREKWFAQPYDGHVAVAEEFRPMVLVIIHHTVSVECATFSQCADELRRMQRWYLQTMHYDIPYNFLVGNDGRVYEGRGWNVVGAHTMRYNHCSVGIGFIGDYREEINSHTRVTEAQLSSARKLLEAGVRMGYLRPDYQVVGAKDLHQTASPGSDIMNAISKWDNYDHQNRFAGLTCSEIHEKYGNMTL